MTQGSSHQNPPDFASPEMVLFLQKNEPKTKWNDSEYTQERKLFIIRNDEPPKSLLAGNTQQTMFNDEFSNQLTLDHRSVIGGSEQGDLGFNTPKAPIRFQSTGKRESWRDGSTTELGIWDN